VPLSIDGLAVAKMGIIGYVIIMVLLSYVAFGFARSLKNGSNGITFGLMCLFASLANEHFYLSVAATLILYPDVYDKYVFVIWLWRGATAIIIISAFVILVYQSWEARRAAKSIR
jgi:hypothetical protein